MMRSGEIAADVQHQVVALMDRYVKALSRTLFEPKWSGDSQRADVIDNRTPRRRQMMA
jgi:hypothetical protein